MRSVQSTLGRHGYLAGTVAVVAATFVLVPFRHLVSFAHLAWLYLCVVGFIAWSAGTAPAVLAALLAFAAGTYFTPPIGVFWVSKPLDLIQLVIFFAGAVVIGTLTSSLHRREDIAHAAERESTALARLAGEMAQGRDVDSIVESAIACLESQPEVRRVVVWLPGDGGLEPRLSRPGDVTQEDRSLSEQAFSRVAAIGLRHSATRTDLLGSAWPASVTDVSSGHGGAFIPLCSASDTEGVLQVVPDRELDEATASLAVSISHLLAIFVASERAMETAARIQGAEEAARVKSAIVSAVSHELKTPLAAAVAGVTDLVSDDVERDVTDMRTELADVAEDLERLQAAIGDLLDLSRLQAAEWMPRPETYEAGEILGDVIAAAPPSLRDRLEFRVEQEPIPEVFADFAQVSRALRAVLDNAIAYSPSGAPVILGAARRDGTTTIWIEDRGPGVSDADKPFVFDRAYRGEAGARTPGSTGLGLTIARDLIEANGGTLSLVDAEPVGTRILVELPATKEAS